MSDVRPVERAILAPYDKSGLVAFASGLAERGVELVASGGTARVLTEAGLAVTPVEQVTGFARDARRAGEDPASRRSTAGCSPTAATPRTCDSSRSSASSPSTCSSPVSTRSARRSRAAPRPTRDRADRHRRARDDARRREELRVGGAWWSIRLATATCSRRSTPRVGSRATRAGRWRPPRSPTPPPTTRPLRRGSPSRGPTTSCRPSSVSPTRRSAICATARTRISGARSTARRRRPARSPAPGCCRARTCRSTTGSTPWPPTSSPPRCPRVPWSS